MSGAGDQDPGAGAPASGGFAEAAVLANFGGSGPHQVRRHHRSARAAHVLAFDLAPARQFLAACQAAHVRYGLGAKVPFHGAVPGQDFTAVDCSGFVREALWRCGVALPDGSVVQHEWVEGKGFVKGTITDGEQADGVVRIAFLRPQDSPSGVGHVVLIEGGATLESHAGTGPDSRPWTGAGWQAKAQVYALTAR